MNEQRILQDLVELKADVKLLLEHRAECKKLEDTMYGNGREGVTTAVAKIEATLRSQKWWLRVMAPTLLALLYKAIW